MQPRYDTLSADIQARSAAASNKQQRAASDLDA